jgi:hypothetical protein
MLPEPDRLASSRAYLAPVPPVGPRERDAPENEDQNGAREVVQKHDGQDSETNSGDSCKRRLNPPLIHGGQ